MRANKILKDNRPVGKLAGEHFLHRWQEFLERRAKRGRRGRFERALSKVRAVEPDENDKV